MDPAVVTATQEAFAGFISKPKFSTKLLSKPPFRYLHDIVSSVTAASGFAEGLFGEGEKNAKSIKGKAAKLDYLNKIVVCVGIANGEACDINLGKIVAGREAEKTNVFLQLLAKVAQDRAVDKEECVKRALAGETPGDRPAPQTGGGADDSGPPPSKTAPADEPSKRPDPEPQSRPAADRDAGGSGSGASKTAPPSKTADSDSGPAGGGGADLAALFEAASGEPEATRAAVSAIVAKPKCSDKLLGKPPFRFLHDVITGIMKATQYRAGLYEGDELNSKAIKGKEMKIDFLNKIIKAVAEDTGRPVGVNPNKVVAGREADKTCQFLHILAIAATHQEALAARGGGGGGGEAAQQAPPAQEAKQQDDGAAREKQRRQEEEGRQREEGVRLERESKAQDAAEKEAASRKAAERKAAERKKAERKAAERKAAEREAAERKAAEREAAERVSQEAAASRVESKTAPTNEGKQQDRPLMSADTELTPADGGEHKVEFQQSIAERPQTKRLLRPSTARRRPPTIRQNVSALEHKQEELQDDYQADGVMLEGEADDESEPEEEEGDAANAGASKGGVESKLGGPDDEHGRLVRDILHDAEKQKASEEVMPAGDEKEAAPQGIRMGRIGSKTGAATGAVNVQALRRQVQQLCQSTNPLGKCIDYVHEDMGMMKKEYERWKSDFDSFISLTEKEVKITEEELLPLTTELAKIEEQIQQKRRQINASNAAIARNDARVAELLRMVVSVHSGSSSKSRPHSK